MKEHRGDEINELKDADHVRRTTKSTKLTNNEDHRVAAVAPLIPANPTVPNLPMPKSRPHMRSWNAALAAVRANVADLALDEPLAPGARQTLRTVTALCNRLAFPWASIVRKTNAELAAKYGCSERTIRYWKRRRAPLGRGQPAMLAWLARRPYVPKGTGRKFHHQLQERRQRLRLEGFKLAYRRLRTLRFDSGRRQTAPPAPADV